jgi:2-(1,2-epoxy-1,2-dihydrophenyl)acetyl-CoA isomerase
LNSTSPVLFQVENGIGRLTLNRPEQGNAISLSMADALAAAIDQAAHSDARVLLLDAHGPRFCSGGDVDELIARRDNLSAHICSVLTMLNPAMLRLASLPLPVVSVVQGSLAGAGIALACCADFTLASSKARLRGAYSAIGLSPDIGASYHLARRIGAAQAKRLLMLNETLDAQRGLDLGLFDEVHPPEHLAAAAQALAIRLAAGATQALGQIRRLCDTAADLDLETQLKLESAAILACSHSADAAEGIAAVLEARPAIFSGH